VAHVVAADDTTPVTIHWAFDERTQNSPKQLMLLSAIAKAGFTIDKPGKQTQKATTGALTIYIKRLTGAFPLVIAPSWENHVTDFEIAGAIRPSDRFYYHNNTMRAFPQRAHTGRDEITYGLDFDFPDELALNRFLGILTGTKADTAIEDNDEMNADPSTESESWRAARLGQTKFRQSLLERYSGRCAISEINMPEVLRASHIKPWCNASNKERLDPDNGLLLAVHLDTLFDKGLIIFR
jgi:putative restriction endonuclease